MTGALVQGGDKDRDMHGRPHKDKGKGRKESHLQARETSSLVAICHHTKLLQYSWLYSPHCTLISLWNLVYIGN